MSIYIYSDLTYNIFSFVLEVSWKQIEAFGKHLEHLEVHVELSWDILGQPEGILGCTLRPLGCRLGAS
eukprot:2481504-Karenia_brevis.AAC.1